MPVPEQIGRFAVLERIGGGAFASVWRAHDEALDSTVAIKVLSENWLDALDVRRRFADEARLLRRAESDRLVRVHDLGELDDGRPYLVMTYADRGTLDERLKTGPLAWPDAVAVAVEIALAVGKLHASGVLHRDIKPSNVLFRSTPDGGEQVMLADLGLGKLLSEASQLTLAVGTPAFMAPEQARPGTPLSVRTDLYGLGAVLYVALTGRNPQEFVAGAKLPTPAPSEVAPDIPSELDNIVVRALAPSPEDRQPDAAAMVAELRRLLATRRGAETRSPAASTPRSVPKPARVARRRLWLVASIVAVLLAAFATAAAFRYLTNPGQVEVADRSGMIRLSVPGDWARQLADSDWDPGLLGITAPRQPAVLVAVSVAGYADPGDPGPGAFVGMLPAGSSLSAPDFDRSVRRDRCLPATAQPTTVDGVLAVDAQRCGDTIVEDVLLSRKDRLVWTQIKEPVANSAHANEVLASLRVG